MRYRFLALLLFVAGPVSAAWWPVWDPENIQITVGESAIVHVHMRWSGLVDMQHGIHQTFCSDMDHVASAYIHITDDLPHDVRIDAHAPGTAVIRELYDNARLDSVQWVRITVVCPAESPVTAVQPLVHGIAGQPVTLAAASEVAERTTFTWWLGRQGDARHPLDGSGPSIAFTPDAPGTYYVWVYAATPCSTSSAEFRIDVTPPRRRPARGGS